MKVLNGKNTGNMFCFLFEPEHYISCFCDIEMLVDDLRQLIAVLNASLSINGYTALPPQDTGDKPARILNNAIKEKLILSHTSDGFRFLDLPCGSGNDVAKLERIKLEIYVGIDLDYNNFLIGAAKNRKSIRDLGEEKCKLYKGDMCDDKLFNKLGITDCNFDVVSCQFAMHYAFEKERTAVDFVKNVSAALKKGGKFIATYPDGLELLKMWGRSSVFSNDLMRITFSGYVPAESEEFGIKYHFKLTKCVNDYEFLIKQSTVDRLFKGAGFELVKSETFKEFFQGDAADIQGMYMALDESNKQIVEFYRYCIYIKK